MISHPPPRGILTCGDGAAIAYHHLPGASPGVMFCTGLMSDMTGDKALCLEDFCRRRGQGFIRFDYRGHGASSGDIAAGTIGEWADDTVAILDEVTKGPQVLVGSSMGGWIMLLAALRRPRRVVGLLGIAAAADFTEDLFASGLTVAQKQAIERQGFTEIPSDYSDQPYIITKALIDDGRRHLVLRNKIPLDCPVRLIHGMGDEHVPWRTALAITEGLRSDDVEVILVKDGGHRLSEDDDLERLCATLESLLRRIEKS